MTDTFSKTDTKSTRSIVKTELPLTLRGGNTSSSHKIIIDHATFDDKTDPMNSHPNFTHKFPNLDLNKIQDNNNSTSHEDSYHIENFITTTENEKLTSSNSTDQPLNTFKVAYRPDNQSSSEQDLTSPQNQNFLVEKITNSQPDLLQADKIYQTSLQRSQISYSSEMWHSCCSESFEQHFDV